MDRWCGRHSCSGSPQRASRCWNTTAGQGAGLGESRREGPGPRKALLGKSQGGSRITAVGRGHHTSEHRALGGGGRCEFWTVKKGGGFSTSPGCPTSIQTHPSSQEPKGDRYPADHPSSHNFPSSHCCGDTPGSGVRELILAQAEGDSVTLGSLFCLSEPHVPRSSSVQWRPQDPALTCGCEWGRCLSHSRISCYLKPFPRLLRCPSASPDTAQSKIQALVRGMGGSQEPAGHGQHFPNLASFLSWFRGTSGL